MPSHMPYIFGMLRTCTFTTNRWFVRYSRTKLGFDRFCESNLQKNQFGPLLKFLKIIMTACRLLWAKSIIRWRTNRFSIIPYVGRHLSIVDRSIDLFGQKLVLGYPSVIWLYELERTLDEDWTKIRQIWPKNRKKLKCQHQNGWAVLHLHIVLRDLLTQKCAHKKGY
jgi:hypothetical protein